MSQDVCKNELQEKTHQLLQGPLKHVKAAALAAALLPLASVAASPAAAQTCGSAGNVSGFVWNDTNQNGIQDAGETGVSGAVVSSGGSLTATDANGVYVLFVEPGAQQIAVQIPNETQPSPPNVGSDDTVDSDGVPDGLGNSVAAVTVTGGECVDADFGLFESPVASPGTGTPGYWKNHPEAWPVENITVGGVSYSKAQAIAWLNNVGKDKRTTMFASLVSAKLNVLVGNEDGCVASTIVAADQWMAAYGPLGSGTSVHASSLAWKVGEPLHRQMDNYNNGMLCAPHRD
jgi:hypothetical protein